MFARFPVSLIPRPFADNGTFQKIPDEKPDDGRASWREGFPVETQLPLSNGGIAPSRPDFNGVFNALSALAFYFQAGGVPLYRNTIDYTAPCVVFFNDGLWWCIKENGPDTLNGTIFPGSNDEYWITFFQFIYESSGGGGAIGSLGNPVGTVITFWGTSAPDGYLVCDGLAFDSVKYPKLLQILRSTNTPDLRGYVIRGVDTRNTIDPDGATREIGSAQQDAGRELTGSFGSEVLVAGATGTPAITGAFFTTNDGRRHIASGNFHGGNQVVNFQASRVWGANTAPEFRMKNKTLLYCIKHD